MKKIVKNQQDTKEKLHLLALKSYLDQGAHNTTFQELANQLGVSQAAIYKHYRSKNELLVGAISYAAEKGKDFLLENERDEKKALERLKNHIEKNLEFCTEQRIYAIAVITLHYFAVCIPEVKALHQQINETRIKRIENYLIQAKHEGTLREINIKETAMMIHSLLMGEMIKAYLWPKEMSNKNRLKIIWRMVNNM